MKKICPYCGRVGELGDDCKGCGYVLSESDKTVKEPKPSSPASGNRQSIYRNTSSLNIEKIIKEQQEISYQQDRSRMQRTQQRNPYQQNRQPLNQSLLNQALPDMRPLRRLLFYNIKEKIFNFIMAVMSIPFFLLAFACIVYIFAPGTAYSMRLIGAGIMLFSSSTGSLCWMTARYMPRRDKRKIAALITMVLGIIVSFCGMVQYP